jgi:predicted outer membrane lipoprotein
MPNGIELILADHEKVNMLFAKFAETNEGSIIGQVIDALTAHDDAEQAALYPLVGALLGDADAVGRSALAHSAVKKQIDAIKALEGAPLAEGFLVLQALVQEHVDDEETNILPALASAATPQQLEGLGARILQAKQRGGGRHRRAAASDHTVIRGGPCRVEGGRVHGPSAGCPRRQRSSSTQLRAG